MSYAYCMLFAHTHTQAENTHTHTHARRGVGPLSCKVAQCLLINSYREKQRDTTLFTRTHTRSAQTHTHARNITREEEPEEEEDWK